MPLVRILVDGYSLIHSWPELARGKARHSSAARTALINILRQYGDAISTPVTVVFDGAGPSAHTAHEAPSTPEMEIIYSKSGQTADDIIERVTARLVAYGEVLVISNDFAERDTVASVGGSCSSCEHFIRTIESTLAEFGRALERHNRAERNRFKTR
jgi:predicted RNA-binding protein with PIN domain